MLIPSSNAVTLANPSSLSRRVNANSQHAGDVIIDPDKLIKKGEC